jgi:hypothetical protein
VISLTASSMTDNANRVCEGSSACCAGPVDRLASRIGPSVLDILSATLLGQRLDLLRRLNGHPRRHTSLSCIQRVLPRNAVTRGAHFGVGALTTSRVVLLKRVALGPPSPPGWRTTVPPVYASSRLMEAATFADAPGMGQTDNDSRSGSPFLVAPSAERSARRGNELADAFAARPVPDGAWTDPRFLRGLRPLSVALGVGPGQEQHIQLLARTLR